MSGVQSRLPPAGAAAVAVALPRGKLHPRHPSARTAPCPSERNGCPRLDAPGRRRGGALAAKMRGKDDVSGEAERLQRADGEPRDVELPPLMPVARGALVG